MKKLKSRKELISLRKELAKEFEAQERKILVCAGSGCVASGSLEVYAKLKEIIEEKGIMAEVELQDHVDHAGDAGLKKCGCLGLCQIGPLVKIEPEGWLYCHVTPDDCEELVTETVVNGKVVERLLFEEDEKVYKTQEEIPFYSHQVHIALENCGDIRVDSIDEYIAVGGYTALEKALFEMSPDEIIAEVSESGLRGRGGAGFPTGKKWSQVAAHKEAPVKYVVCNGDEGDPGAFMDRSIMEGDPNSIVEAMAICGYAIGAKYGLIYVRAEYPLAIHRLQTAISQARELGLLGKDILGTGFEFDITLRYGAGAFVCGEETALIHSMEGKRGEPTLKPPFPAVEGYRKYPTNVNNVETWANIPVIFQKGPEWFASIGTEKSKGTKVFALAGKINKMLVNLLEMKGGKGCVWTYWFWRGKGRAFEYDGKTEFSSVLSEDLAGRPVLTQLFIRNVRPKFLRVRIGVIGEDVNFLLAALIYALPKDASWFEPEPDRPETPEETAARRVEEANVAKEARWARWRWLKFVAIVAVLVGLRIGFEHMDRRKSPEQEHQVRLLRAFAGGGDYWAVAKDMPTRASKSYQERVYRDLAKFDAVTALYKDFQATELWNREKLDEFVSRCAAVTNRLGMKKTSAARDIALGRCTALIECCQRAKAALENEADANAQLKIKVDFKAKVETCTEKERNL